MLLACSILCFAPILAQDELLFSPAYRDTRISLIANAIADISGREIYFDAPGRDRAISLTTQSPVTREEVWQISEQALSDHGLELIESDDVWRIIPTSKEVVVF